MIARRIMRFLFVLSFFSLSSSSLSSSASSRSHPLSPLLPVFVGLFYLCLLLLGCFFSRDVLVNSTSKNKNFRYFAKVD